MDKPVAGIIDAHGDLDRWSALRYGEATIKTGGGGCRLTVD